MPYASGTPFTFFLINNQHHPPSRLLLWRLPHVPYLKATVAKDREMVHGHENTLLEPNINPLRPSCPLRTWPSVTPSLQFLFSDFLVFFSAKKLRWKSKSMGVGGPFLEQFSNENCEQSLGNFCRQCDTPFQTTSNLQALFPKYSNFIREEPRQNPRFSN